MGNVICPECNKQEQQVLNKHAPKGTLIGVVLGSLLAVMIVYLICYKYLTSSLYGKCGYDPEKTGEFYFPSTWHYLPQTSREHQALVNSPQVQEEYLCLASNLVNHVYLGSIKDVKGKLQYVTYDLPPQIRVTRQLYGYKGKQREPFGIAAELDDPVSGEEPSGGRDKLYMMAFRGTLSDRNWLTNLNYAQKKYKDKFFVHRGYLSLLESMNPALRELVDAYPQGATVLLTGHSLGGALAMLVATELKEWRPDLRLFLVLFGSPRIGCPELAKYIEGPCTEDSVNVQNSEDSVCHLPPPAVLQDKEHDTYSKKRDHSVYSHCGRFLVFSWNRGSLALNHHIHVYTLYMDKLYQKKKERESQ